MNQNAMIPNKKDWEEALKSLDGVYAFKHFNGKSLQQAEDMIDKVAELYCEDFKWMPEQPFKFYLLAYLKYLRSNKSEYNFYASISFLGLIEYIVDYRPHWVTDRWGFITEIFEKMIERAKRDEHFWDSENIIATIRKIKTKTNSF